MTKDDISKAIFQIRADILKKHGINATDEDLAEGLHQRIEETTFATVEQIEKAGYVKKEYNGGSVTPGKGRE